MGSSIGVFGIVDCKCWYIKITSTGEVGFIDQTYEYVQFVGVDEKENFLAMFHKPLELRSPILKECSVMLAMNIIRLLMIKQFRW